MVQFIIISYDKMSPRVVSLIMFIYTLPFDLVRFEEQLWSWYTYDFWYNWAKRISSLALSLLSSLSVLILDFPHFIYVFISCLQLLFFLSTCHWSYLNFSTFGRDFRFGHSAGSGKVNFLLLRYTCVAEYMFSLLLLTIAWYSTEPYIKFYFSG